MTKDEIQDVVREAVQRFADEAMARSGADIELLLEGSIGRAVLREALRVEFVEINHAVWGHVADWLAASVLAELPWLANVDERGFQKKFSKFTDVSSVVAEAQRGLDRIAKNAKAVELSAVDFETVSDFDGGFRLVRLLTVAALSAEGKEMQHCVGTGGYGRGVEAGSTVIYSLRDARGNAHVTMEYDVGENEIRQIKGKQNRFPARKYFDIVIPWIEQRRMQVRETELGGGYIRARSGQIRNVLDFVPGETVPDGFTVVFDEDAPVELRFPEGVRIGGNVLVQSRGTAPVTVVVSPGATVLGFVTFQNADVTGLENLRCANYNHVRGRLLGIPRGSAFDFGVDLQYVHVDGGLGGLGFNGKQLTMVGGDEIVVPRGLKVAHRLAVAGCRSVVFEDGADIEGSVAIGSSGAPSDEIALVVGNGVRVGGDFDHRGGTLNCGRDLNVAGSLRLDCVIVERLPSGLDLGGLMLRYVAGVTRLPEDMVLRGALEVRYGTLKTLQGLSEVNGGLVVSHSEVDTLPEGLRVRGNLDIGDSIMEALPARLTVDGALRARRSRITALPEDISIGGDVDLSHSVVRSIPDHMHVRGSLNLQDTKLDRYPTGVVVDGMLNLGRFRLESVGLHFQASDYVLNDAKIADFSDLSHVPGNLWLGGSQVALLPEGFSVGGNIVMFEQPEGGFPSGLRVSGYVKVPDPRAASLFIPRDAVILKGVKNDGTSFLDLWPDIGPTIGFSYA